MAEKSVRANVRYYFSESYFRASVARLTPGQRLWLDLMMFVLMILCLAILYFGGALARDTLVLHRLSQTGTKTVAKVESLAFESSRGANWTSLTYAFKAADGRTYTGSARRDGHKFFRDAKEVVIQYDAGDPRRSTPVFDISHEIRKGLLLALILSNGTLLTLLIVYRYVRARRRDAT